MTRKVNRQGFTRVHVNREDENGVFCTHGVQVDYAH